MKVLHLINGLCAAGAEVMLFNLARKLKERGVEQSLVTLMPGGGLEERFIAEGLEPRDVGMKQGVPSVGALLRLRSEIRISGADVVLAWLYHSCWAASLAAPSGVPVVWGIHHTLTKLSEEKRLTRLLIQGGTWLSRRVAGYVYVSQLSADQHFEVGYPRTNAAVIPNGFDLEGLSPSEKIRHDVRRELGVVESATVFGSAARYHPNKNHVGLVEAFGAVAQEREDAVLLLAGRGVDSANRELAEAVAASGAASKIRLLGERTDMARLMNGMDFYVSASRWSESFPLVLGEAMATKVPCIATDLGDCAYIVGDIGRVIEADRPEALKNALAWALNLGVDDRKRLGELARRRVGEKFGLDPVADRYIEVLKGVTRPR